MSILYCEMLHSTVGHPPLKANWRIFAWATTSKAMQKLLIFDFTFHVVVTWLLINAKTASSSSLIIKIILMLLLLQIKTIRAFFIDTDLLSSSSLTALRTSIVFYIMSPPCLRIY